MTLVNYRSCFW